NPAIARPRTRAGGTWAWQVRCRSALGRHDALVRDCIAAHDGFVVKGTGDGVHAVFATAHDAISAAIPGQRALAAEQWDEAVPCRSGWVSILELPLRLARNSAKRDRTRALNQMRALITTAPDELRAQLRELTIPRLVRAAAGFRPAGRTDVTNANR